MLAKYAAVCTLVRSQNLFEALNVLYSSHKCNNIFIHSEAVFSFFFLFKNMTSLAQQKAYAFQQAILLFFSNITTT